MVKGLYIYVWRERVFALKQWQLQVEKAINTHLYINRDMHHAYIITCSEYMYQLTGHWIRNRLVYSNLTVVE